LLGSAERVEWEHTWKKDFDAHLADEIKRKGWGRERWGAKSANPLVTHVQFDHSCGCCPDPVLYACCSLGAAEEDPFIVHSDPTRFIIGQKDPCSGTDEPSYKKDWAAELRAANIPEKVVAYIAKYFEEQELQRDSILQAESRD
jgi:hypothetical protein